MTIGAKMQWETRTSLQQLKNKQQDSALGSTIKARMVVFYFFALAGICFTLGMFSMLPFMFHSLKNSNQVFFKQHKEATNSRKSFGIGFFDSCLNFQWV